MSRLHKLCDTFLQAAKSEHLSDGIAQAALLVLRRDGGGCLMRPQGVLGPYADAILDLLRRFDGVGLLYVAEMWKAEYPLPKNHADMSVLDLPEPKDMPEKKEAIRVIAVTADGEKTQKLSTIHRTALGSIFEDSEFSEPTLVRDGTGRFLAALLEAK